MNAFSPAQQDQIKQVDTANRAMLVKRAQGLNALLTRNAPQSERDRRVAEENVQAMSDAGLFKTMVPRRYGGFESSMRTHLDVTAAIAEACGSSAWVLALTNVCNWFVGLYGQKAQDEVFGANPDARVAGVLAPSTEVRRVEGGVIVSGKWYWASGILHADWAGVGLLELDATGAPADQYWGLIPMSELRIEDTWFVAGMKGTGSNCVVAKDVFVPEYRLLSISKALAGEYPTEHKDEAAYRVAIAPAFALVLVGAQLGMARAALKYVIEKASQRAIAYTSFEKQIDSVAFQIQVSRAATKIDSAHLHAYRAAEVLDGAALRGEHLEYLLRARVRADTGYVAQQVTEAIDILLTAHGAGSFADSNPMQRIWRDSNTAARHAVVLQPVGEEIYGKALLGVENTVTTLV